MGLAAGVEVVHRDRFLHASLSTAGPFLTLAVVIGAGLAMERLGLFRLLARALLPSKGPRWLCAAAVLALTALISGLVNLDVAVVVAVPIAVNAAMRSRMAPASLAVATALTANASSFLMPTSNVTTLLILSRSPLPLPMFLEQSWMAWTLVTVFTVCALALTAGLGRRDPEVVMRRAPTSRWFAPLLDLAPLFLCATAIRAVIGSSGVPLGGGFLRDVIAGSGLSAALNNLPAATALQPSGSSARWAAVVALALGPNLWLTGSVATVVARRLARYHGVGFPVGRFALLGVTLLPVQLLLAGVGLTLSGGL